MLINKENKDYRLYSWNVNSIIILSTFGILLLYLSNTFLYDDIKQVWADSVIATIPVGHNPEGVAYNGYTHDVYVANYGDNTVAVINSSNQVIATIPVGDGPTGIGCCPDGGQVLVSNSRSNTITRIAGNEVITIPVGRDYQFGVVDNPSNGDRYIVDLFHSRVEVTNPTHPNQVFPPIYDPAMLAPFDIAYISRYWLYVCN